MCVCGGGAGSSVPTLLLRTEFKKGLKKEDLYLDGSNQQAPG